MRLDRLDVPRKFARPGKTGCDWHQCRLKFCGLCLVCEPKRVIECDKSLAFGLTESGTRCAGFVEPGSKARDGRQRDEVPEARKVSTQILDDLFDQEVAERNPRNPSWQLEIE